MFSKSIFQKNTIAEHLKRFFLKNGMIATILFGPDCYDHYPNKCDFDTNGLSLKDILTIVSYHLEKCGYKIDPSRSIHSEQCYRETFCFKRQTLSVMIHKKEIESMDKMLSSISEYFNEKKTEEPPTPRSECHM